jgi:Cu-Zn family superoxide dismutase
VKCYDESSRSCFLENDGRNNFFLSRRFPMKKSLTPMIVFLLSGIFANCAFGADITKAHAVIAPTQGHVVLGNVSFTQEAAGVRLVADISGLKPGAHGFHIHEKGDCSAPDASSAGGHFNPGRQAHGKVGEGAHHAGDLPSLEADAEGKAKLDVTLNSLSLSGEHAIVGRALIVHADPDDFKTQPAGNAGGRVACGVITQH